MSVSFVPKDCLQIFISANPSLSSTENLQMQSKFWSRIRKLLEEQQFRCIEFYNSASGSSSPTISSSPLRTFMTRGVTMPELRMSALATSMSSINDASNSPSVSPNSGEEEENVRKSPIRAITADNSATAANNTGQSNNSAIKVCYNAPFEIAQPFANQIYALAAELNLDCRVNYGGKQLQTTEMIINGVSRRNSDSASRWNQFAVKNWHEECTSNPNSPRYSPREVPGKIKLK